MRPREVSWEEVESSQNCGESRSKLENLISVATVELGRIWKFSKLNSVFTKRCTDSEIPKALFPPKGWVKTLKDETLVSTGCKPSSDNGFFYHYSDTMLDFHKIISVYLNFINK